MAERGPNLYAYVGDSPTGLTAPSGRCPMCIGTVIGAVIGAVAGVAGYAAFHEGDWDWGSAATEVGPRSRLSRIFDA